MGVNGALKFLAAFQFVVALELRGENLPPARVHALPYYFQPLFRGVQAVSDEGGGL